MEIVKKKGKTIGMFLFLYCVSCVSIGNFVRGRV